jgi:hypothetical protein
VRLTTSAASILLGCIACGAGADTEAEGRVAFPDALPDPADQEVGCREVTSAALTFLLLTGWVTADASAADVSGAPGVLAVGVAGSEEEEADFFSGAAVSASSDVLEAVWAPPVLTTTPGSADRVAR